MTRDEKVLPETRVCCQCCANVCSRSQALGVVCSRCPTTIEIAPPPEKKLLVLSRARLDSRPLDLAEPVRGRPDAGARGGTQRKQHLDEDPPRAPLRRAPELPQQHRRRLDSRFFLHMTRIV